MYLFGMKGRMHHLIYVNLGTNMKSTLDITNGGHFVDVSNNSVQIPLNINRNTQILMDFLIAYFAVHYGKWSKRELT